MTKGILGKKVGMTQIFTEAGELIPVTVIEATPNVVLQVKTVETDGYNAIQVGFDDKREVLSNKPAKGHVAKANTAPKRFIREFKNVEGLEVGAEITVETFAAGDVVDVTGTSKGKGFQDLREVLSNKPAKGHVAKANATPKRFIREFREVELGEYQVGQEITVETFAAGDIVDVTGTSKGKGFQGAIKRHGQSRGPMAHGSRYHRRPGSMGGASFPSRVFKGKGLPGQTGGERVTIQNLEVVAVDVENNVILIKGNVPGAKKSLVEIKQAIKTVK